MNAEQLREAHGGVWGEYLDYPVADWIMDARNGDTRLGYWEWVAHQVEAREDELVEDDTDDKCDSCGEPFTYKDIDGGRCLSCGTMICGKSPEEG
jgi:hypothetical protein